MGSPVDVQAAEQAAHPKSGPRRRPADQLNPLHSNRRRAQEIGLHDVFHPKSRLQFVECKRATPSGVSYTVLDSYNHIDEHLEREWDELAMQTGASIYLTCAWSRIWWEVYGNQHLIRIFICRSEGKLVGVLPIYIEELRLGWLNIRVARLLGAYNPPRVCDLPIVRDFAASICVHVARDLVGASKCDLVSIGPLSDECDSKSGLFAAVEEMRNELGIVQRVPFGVYTYFDLPDTYDAYMLSLSKSERKNRQYYQRLLEKEKDVRVTVLTRPDEIEEEVPLFFALHAAQWQPQGRLGYFDAWPESAAFNRRVAVGLAHLDRTRLIRMTAGGKPVLYEYRYKFGPVSYWQVSARMVSEEWNRFSLGATGAVAMIRSSIDEGIKRIEGGVSHYDYKMRLGAVESGLSILRLSARRPSSIAKYCLFLACHTMCLNCYYKLWYSRLQPKLPAFLRRPIWKMYTRLSF